MLKPYELLENVLLDIESGIKNDINTQILSQKYDYSTGHLRRLFKFAFKQSITAYIRSRKLAASLDELLGADTNILDIALEYGFEYEQSYIRAFKREFGKTPGDLRKTRQIIKIKPPLHLFDENRLGGDIFFVPEIVMVPQFHIIGKRHQIPFDKTSVMNPHVAKYFWENERNLIKNAVNPKIFIGITHEINQKEKHIAYLPSIQVKKLKNIPHGFNGFNFETSMCARFRYIGQHHYYDINKDVASMMYNSIINFSQSEHTRYMLSNDQIYFELIDTTLYDGTYCQMEWYTPVSEKKCS